MDKYMRVALTGNRYAGKDSVGQLFAKLGIPVFDADSVMKFIINYSPAVVKAVKGQFGESYILGEFINPLAFDTDDAISRLIDLVDIELFHAYEKFHNKYKHTDYTIFNCGAIFEKRWESRFDFVINVSSPADERKYRYKMKNTDSNEWIFNDEISDVGKNRKSDYVIHNQENGPDVRGQVLRINSDLEEVASIRSGKTTVNDYLRNASYKGAMSRREVEAITT